MWKIHRPILMATQGQYPAAKQRVRSLVEQRNAAEGTSMDEKWRVGNVELLEGGLLFGFVLYDQKGRPCVSFGYADDKKANLGHNHVAAAIKDADQVLAR
jgi:hypothetical protein